MKVYVENENLRVVDGIGNYWNREYQVQKRYCYYNEKIDNVDYDWKLVYHSTELKWCMEYFEKHKNDVEKKQSAEEIEYLISIWS